MFPTRRSTQHVFKTRRSTISPSGESYIFDWCCAGPARGHSSATVHVTKPGLHPPSVRELKPNPFINHRGRIAKCSPFICPLCGEPSTQPVKKTQALSAYSLSFSLSLSPGQRPLCRRHSLTSLACKPIQPLSNN